MGDESGWCTCRPKFGPSGGFDITGCPVHGHREREQHERDEEHWQATVGDPPVQDGVRTDDHEYRGSHHQTPGTLQGGRTDAQQVSELDELRGLLSVLTEMEERGHLALNREGQRSLILILTAVEASLATVKQKQNNLRERFDGHQRVIHLQQLDMMTLAGRWIKNVRRAWRYRNRLVAVEDALRLVQQAATPPTGPVAAIAYDPLTHIRHIVSEALAPADTGQGIAEEERCSTCGATPETGISSDCPECYGIYPKKNAAGGSGS